MADELPIKLLDGLLAPFEQLFACFSIEHGENELNKFKAFIKIIIRKVFIEFIGWFGVQLAKIFIQGLKALEDALKLIDPTDKLNAVKKAIVDFITPAFNELKTLTSDGKAWVLRKLNGMFDNVDFAVPNLNLNFGIFSLNLTGNAVFQAIINGTNQSAEWIAKKYKAISKIICDIITGTFAWLLKSVTEIKKIIEKLVDWSKIGEIPQAITDFKNYIAGLVSPLTDIIITYTKLFIGLFVDGAQAIANIFGELYQWIIAYMGGMSLNDILPKINVSIHPIIKKIFLFVVCLIKFIFTLMVYVFGFMWVI